MTTGIMLTNGRWAVFPHGYLYQANTYCPDCILHIVMTVTEMPEEGSRNVAEDILTSLAESKGIDYSDEYSYDSDDFPKAITELDPDSDIGCAECGIELREV